jgi:hypothetical protein
MLSGRGLCVGLITRPEQCDREASTVRRPWPTRAVVPLEKINTDITTVVVVHVLVVVVADELVVVVFTFVVLTVGGIRGNEYRTAAEV